MTNIQVSTVALPGAPFGDMKPGTSGLRKRVKVFQQPHYTEVFVAATLAAIPAPGPVGQTLVVGGDGRFFSAEAIQIITRLAAAAGVSKLIVGQNGILSTPAVSNLIRKRKVLGGIILTASHNPGGPDNDFGIKYNISNGGPAPESVTDKIYEISKNLHEYQIATLPELDLSKLGVQELAPGFLVEVVDSTEDYVQMLQEIFDFETIRKFLAANSSFKVLFDSMHGVTGPYATRIFVNELGLPATSVMNNIPLPDFGGGHPDPNLTYAHELVERVRGEGIDFGAASDGDGDRNMILAKDWFVTPSDSVAVIAAHAQHIPYFQKTGLKGLARSMPTSCALDRVAKKKNVEIFEVPTGWKFFGNLMDAGRLSICGEESFGTGSDHIREKDGIWAVVAWLNILAAESLKRNELVSVRTISLEHYKEYGRNFFSRYDYEECESAPCNAMIDDLRRIATEGSVIGTVLPGFDHKISFVDDFKYVDPIDASVSAKQGIRVIFEDGSRFIMRLSGTGSSGATVRLYVERYSSNPADFERDTQEALSPLIKAALFLSKLPEHTKRESPTVIT